MTQTARGIKYDGEKPQMYLVPPLALLEVGKVLTYGATKYSPDNWRRVPELQERYTSAALRHILAEMAGEECDEETDLSHLAHAICCLLFKLEDKLLHGKSKEEGVGEPIRSKCGESVSTSESLGGWYETNNEKRGLRDIEYLLLNEPIRSNN